MLMLPWSLIECSSGRFRSQHRAGRVRTAPHEHTYGLLCSYGKVDGQSKASVVVNAIIVPPARWQ